MRTHRRRAFAESWSLYRPVRSAALVVCTFLLASCSPDKPLPRDSQTVDGVTVYLGVMPAELVRDHSTVEGDPNALHGGTPQNQGSHHIVVALFNAQTGARISDARIRAGVGDRSYDHEPDRWLEPMQIAGTTTYGNFFPMQGPGAWRIHLEIHRPGLARPLEADFGYERAADF